MCVRHCYIFHVSDDCRTYHSVYIQVFDKAALLCDGQQACVCLVWLNAVRHIWKQLWWLDSVWHAGKCVFTLLEALLLSWLMVESVHILVNDEPALFVCLPECVLCSPPSWSRPRWEFGTCDLSLPPMETDRELETLGSRIWNMLMNRHNNNPSSHTWWKEDEKLCRGCSLYPTLFQDKLKWSPPRGAFAGFEKLYLHHDSPSCIKTSVIKSNSFLFKGTHQTVDFLQNLFSYITSISELFISCSIHIKGVYIHKATILHTAGEYANSKHFLVIT